MPSQYTRFKDFYPFYLEQHRNPICRRLHVFGCLSVIVLVLAVIAYQSWQYLWLLPLVGYGPAWVGHYWFEHNRPATFSHPWYSLLADWVMLKDILLGKVPF